MKIQITGKDFQLTPSLRQYVEGRAEKFLQYQKGIQGITFALTVERHHQKGEKFIADANVKMNKKDLFALSRNSDMRTAIDEVVEKIDQQLRKEKDRRVSQRRRGE